MAVSKDEFVALEAQFVLLNSRVEALSCLVASLWPNPHERLVKLNEITAEIAQMNLDNIEREDSKLAAKIQCFIGLQKALQHEQSPELDG